MTDIIEIYHYGVGNQIQTLKIKPINLSDDINFAAVSIIHNLKNKDDSFDINIVSLDYFNFENISLIKINVKHMEIEVLEGSLNLISRCKPTIIIETYKLSKLKETNIFKEFLKLGYEIDIIPEGYNVCIMKIKLAF